MPDKIFLRIIKYLYFVLFSSSVLYMEAPLFSDSTCIERSNFEIIGSIKLFDINNNLIELSQKKGKIVLIILFDPHIISHKETVSYAQVLYRRFHQKELDVIGISNRDMNATRELFEYGNYSFPFVSDNKGTIYEKFQMKSCCGGVILINNKAEVVFKMPTLLKSENLRQRKSISLMNR